MLSMIENGKAKNERNAQCARRSSSCHTGVLFWLIFALALISLVEHDYEAAIVLNIATVVVRAGFLAKTVALGTDHVVLDLELHIPEVAILATAVANLGVIKQSPTHEQLAPFRPELPQRRDSPRSALTSFG